MEPCTQCGHAEDSHGYSHAQGTYWCSDCGNWCDLDVKEDEQ